jgi:outer membrane protein TolC
VGFGSGAVGAGDPRASGLSLDLNIADAYFKPLQARQDRNAAAAASKVNRLQVVEDVTTAYYRLLQNHAEQAITQEALQRAEKLAVVTADFADTGEGLKTDAEMASVQTFIWQQRLEAARINAEISSLALVQLLHLASDMVLEPSDTEVPMLDIFKTDEDIDVLISQALNNRPETEQHEAQLQAAEQNVKQETYGPLIPRVSANYSSSVFGGSGSTFDDHSSYRDDFSVMLYWQLDNLGFSRRARLNEKQARIRRLQNQRDKTLDQIVVEVRSAYLQVRSQRRQLELSQQAVAIANNAYTLVSERIFEHQGLPLEVLQSMQSLADAQSLHLQTLINYNLAQIQLHSALGNPISNTL